MFQHAITRTPCKNYVQGLTSAHLGPPDLQLTLEQHRQYVQALIQCGLEVTVLDADESFPDSCFVEDTAVIIPEAAIIANPGAPSRRGEVLTMQQILQPHRTLHFIQPPGTLEGGDVLQVNRHFYIGITARTNKEGGLQLSAFLQQYGYSSTLIPVTNSLHLKTEVNYLGNNYLLASAGMAALEAFRACNVIVVEEKDLYAANCLMINGHLIMPAGFGRVKAALLQAGFHPLELEMSEFEKMDGGLTCLSLRF